MKGADGKCKRTRVNGDGHARLAMDMQGWRWTCKVGDGHARLAMDRLMVTFTTMQIPNLWRDLATMLGWGG